MNDMKIAQVAPLYESVPPKLYGSMERVAPYLTEELVRRRAWGNAFCQRRLSIPDVVRHDTRLIREHL
jgi:hypothetical protein